MPDATPADAITQNAEGPRRVQTPEGMVEQHSLVDQVAADVHRRRVASARHPFSRLRRALASFSPIAGNTTQPIPGSDYIWRP